MKGKFIFVDAEWFIGGQIFLIGYAKGKFSDSGTAIIDKFHYVVEKSIRKNTATELFKGIKYIFVYGPDIGIMERHFKMEIKSKFLLANY